MRRVIDGKLYDTETATILAIARFDETHIETLYISPKGQYFVNFIGTDPVEDGIFLHSTEQAKEWFESCMDANIEMFGDFDSGLLAGIEIG